MVTNILKDGSELKDLTGRIIQREELPELYRTIEQIYRRKEAADERDHQSDR